MPLRFGLHLLLSATLAGCAVGTPTHVATLRATSAPNLVSLDSLAPEGSEASELVRGFAARLIAELEARGMATVAGSSAALSIGIAQRPASVGVGQANGSTMIWTTSPRPHRWYEACDALRVDAVVTLREVTGGLVTGSWRGGFDDCQPSQDQVNNLAREFARAITGKP